VTQVAKGSTNGVFVSSRGKGSIENVVKPTMEGNPTEKHI
jgi:hypothetical protein